MNEGGGGNDANDALAAFLAQLLARQQQQQQQPQPANNPLAQLPVVTQALLQVWMMLNEQSRREREQTNAAIMAIILGQALQPANAQPPLLVPPAGVAPNPNLGALANVLPAVAAAMQPIGGDNPANEQDSVASTESDESDSEPEAEGVAIPNAIQQDQVEIPQLPPPGQAQQVDDALRHIPQTFPIRLYRLIIDAERNDQEHIIQFNDAGNTILLHEQNGLMELLAPQHLRMTKFSSFRRQMEFHGFERALSEDGSLEYRHALFHRDRPGDLMSLTRRQHRRG